MRRRALRLLDAGRAPAAWMRRAERRGARLRALERASAWAPELAAVRPALRRGPLLGDTLDALSTLEPRAASSSADEASGPTSLPRRADSVSIPTPRAASGEAAADGFPDRAAAQRPRTPRERRAAATDAHRRMRRRAATLPRRVDEAALRRMTADPDAGTRSTARAAEMPGTPRAGDRFDWDEFVRKANRAALAPSPHVLPHLAAAGRAVGWSGEAARRRVSLDAVRSADDGEARWIGVLADRAARRFFRGVTRLPGMEREMGRWVESPVPASPIPPSSSRSTPDARIRRFGSPPPARESGILPLAAEWAAPVHGPAVAASVLARLAGRVRTVAPSPGGDVEGRRDVSAPSLLRAHRRRVDDDRETADGGDGDASPDPPPFRRPAPATGGAPALRSILRRLSIPGGAAGAGDPAAAMDAVTAEDRGERWPGWPAVLPWPRRGSIAAARGETARRAGPAAAPASPSPRPSATPPASRETGRDAPSAGAAPRDGGTPPAPIAPGEPYRAPLPVPMTPGPFPPRAAIGGDTGAGLDADEALRPPSPLATGEDAAPWAGAWGAPAQGGQAMAGHLFAGDAERAAEELDDALARRIKRILDAEARRYGIDV